VKNNKQQVATLLQRDRAAGWLSYGQRWKTVTGDNVYRYNRSTFNHCDVINQQSIRIGWKKTQNIGYYAVQGHSRSSKSVSIESPYATSY